MNLMGRDRLLSAPAYEVREVDEGVLLALSEDPRIWSSAEYKAIEHRVVDHLGKEYFFSRDEPERKTIAPDFNPTLPR